jgi:hypothetical protein
MGSFFMSVDGIAPLLFLKNPNDLPVKLNLERPLENSKDTFYFLTDLLFKGLYYMITGDYANCKVVNLSDVSIETFFVAKKKLKNMGVTVNINLLSHLFDKSSVKSIHKKSLEVVKEQPDNLPLESYSLHLPLHESVYDISFTLVHCAYTPPLTEA